MNKDNFDIKTFSAENIRIMQQREISDRSNELYEHLALEIYKEAKNKIFINEYTATTCLSVQHVEYVYNKFQEKGFTATFIELENDDSDYRRFQITVSW
jgi:hypothetical protein